MKKIALIYFCFLFSCVPIEENNSLISINMDNVQKNIKLSELVQIDSLVRIKSNIYEPFGEVKRIFKEDSILIVHTNEPQSISIIDLDGKIINQQLIDYKLNDITSIHIFENQMYVLDREGMSILLFDLNLNLIYKISIPFYAQSFSVINDSIISLYVGNESTTNTGSLILYNWRESKIIKDSFPIQEELRSYFNFLTDYNFFSSNERLFFWQSADNIIYRITEKGDVSPTFIFDYGSKAVPIDYYIKNNFTNPFEFIQHAKSQDYSHRHFKILASDDYVYINFDFGKHIGTTLYQYANRTSKSFNYLIDDIWANEEMGEMKYMFFQALYDKNSFIGFLPFEYLNSDTLQYGDYLVFGKLKLIK